MNNWPRRLSRETVMEITREAFEAWSNVSPLRFIQTDGHNADIPMLFERYNHGDNRPFDGPGHILAHAFVTGPIHFDADEDWQDKSKDPWRGGIDYFSVVLHEIGHSLGLSHSNDTGSVMFPLYRQHFELGEDDKLGMHHLYGYFEDGNRTPERKIPSTRRTTRRWPTSTRYTTQRYSTRRHWPTSTTRTRPTTESPHGQRCHGSFDAVTLFRDEFFIFKGRYMWRLRDRVAKLPPFEFRGLFQFPSHVQKIDAIYERLSDSTLLLFTGNQYWTWSRDFRGPFLLTDLGLPAYLESIDAVVYWEQKSKAYIFSGNNYWRYDEIGRRMDPGYPQPISQWRGLPSNVDSAFTWEDGKTYVTKGNQFWRLDFHNNNAKLMHQSASAYWLGCMDSFREVCNIC